MTQIITLVGAPYGVIQVADRLTSQVLSPNKPARKYDTRTNKTLLYIGTDCLVAMSCTGFAYIGKQPIDNWLAGKILGPQMPKETPGAFALSSGPNFPSYTLYSLVALLQEAIEKVATELPPGYRKAWRAHYFGIALGIWQWHPQTLDAWPQLLCVYKTENTKSTKVEYTFTPPQRNQTAVRFTPHMYIPHSEVEATADQIISLPLRPAPTDKPIAVIEMMVNKVREISRRSSTVGDDCISIWIPPVEDTSRDHIHIDFYPANPHHVSDSPLRPVLPATYANVPTIYSPWILTTSGYAAPMVSTTGHTFTFPPWTIHLGASPGYPPPPAYGLSSQPRKPPS